LEYSKDNVTNVAPPNQTNRYSFGKLQIKIHGLYNVANIGKLFFRLKMGPFILETRKIKMPDKDKYKAGQDFYIPITNRFDVLSLEIVSYVTTGLFQGQHK
jgi:hypothetical protein